MCRSDRSFYSRMGIFVQFTLLVLAFGIGGSLCDQTENRLTIKPSLETDSLTIKPSSKAVDPIQLRLNNLEGIITNLRHQYTSNLNRQTLAESKMAELTEKLHFNSTTDSLTIKPNSKAIDPIQLRLNYLEGNVSNLFNTYYVPYSYRFATYDLSPVNCTRSNCRKMTVQGRTFNLLFENNEHGSDWIVFQSRIDGNNTVDFFRNWVDYRNGFGTVNGEFWLGLETIHWLTSAKNYSLLVMLEDYKGVKNYARYDRFVIGAEWEGYNLKTLGSYNGTAGDGLDYHRGQKFSTFDRDQDMAGGGNCALDFKGGWWYKSCTGSNLNALHQTVYNKTAIYFNLPTAYKISRMLIRAV